MTKTSSLGMKRFWEGWKRIGQAVGNFQARVLLTFFYGVLLFPFGVCVRFFADTLRMKRRPSSWLRQPQERLDMTWAHKQ